MKYILWATLTLVILNSHASVEGQTVFHYRLFPTDGSRLPVIPDEGPAGNDGTADGSLKLSKDIATDGVDSSAGLRSLDGKGTAGVSSAGTQELANSLIAGAGGFTMESWFKWKGGGTVNSIIDYAGTEKLVIDTREGAGNEVRMRVNSDATLDSVIGTVDANQWHYAAAVFDTLGNPVDGGSITGKFDLYFDGSLVQTTADVTISEFGDTLDRNIGTAKHPQGFESDFFDGLVYEPRVSLGALEQSELLYVVPEPSSVVLLALGFAAMLWRRRR